MCVPEMSRVRRMHRCRLYKLGWLRDWSVGIVCAVAVYFLLQIVLACETDADRMDRIGCDAADSKASVRRVLLKCLICSRSPIIHRRRRRESIIIIPSTNYCSVLLAITIKHRAIIKLQYDQFSFQFLASHCVVFA